MNRPSYLVFFAAMALSTVAGGQIIGKVPPAAEPTPEYTPPAPPPPPAPAPAPAQPPEPEQPPPTLAVMEPNGELRRYPKGAERAAVTLYPFEPAVREKIDASIAARQKELERDAAAKIDQIVEAMRTRDSLETINDIAAFSRVKDVAAPLQSGKLIDRLLRDGAITPMQRSRLDQMVKQYETALKSQWEGQTGEDIGKILGVIARESFTNVTRDMLAAADRLLARAALKAADIKPALNLTSDQATRFDAAVRTAQAQPGQDDAAIAARAAAIRPVFLEVLTAEQRKVFVDAALPGPDGAPQP